MGFAAAGVAVAAAIIDAVMTSGKAKRMAAPSNDGGSDDELHLQGNGDHGCAGRGVACSSESHVDHAKVDESQTVTAVAVTGSGRQMTARQISWISSDPNVAQVAPDGEVTGMRVGTAQRTASSGGASGTVQVTVTYPDFAFTINDYLVSRVVVAYNGTSLGTFAGSSSRTVTVPGAFNITLEWAMIRPGEEPAGTSTLNPGNNTAFTFQIDNVTENTTYFAPLVSNNTRVRPSWA